MKTYIKEYLKACESLIFGYWKIRVASSREHELIMRQMPFWYRAKATFIVTLMYIYVYALRIIGLLLFPILAYYEVKWCRDKAEINKLKRALDEANHEVDDDGDYYDYK